MEKVIVIKSHTTKKTKVCCTRYGNIMCSRESVIPLWINQILINHSITMSQVWHSLLYLWMRWWISYFSQLSMEKQEIFSSRKLWYALFRLMWMLCVSCLVVYKNEDIKIIGIRHSEKMYETLLTNQRRVRSCHWHGELLSCSLW